MNTKQLNWNVPAADNGIIYQIAQRAAKLAAKHQVKYLASDAAMDIVATHANGTPLRLTELLAADDSNFAHDVFGIRRHLNRETGELTDCFCPRYTA